MYPSMLSLKSMSKSARIASAVFAVAILTTAGIVVAQTGGEPEVKKLASTSKTTEKATVETPAAQAQTQTTAKVASAPATQSAASTETAPLYGEDPAEPGTFKVFNTTEIMTQAGVAAADQQLALAVINGLSGWRYKVTSNTLNLCDVQPINKMASVGSDYETNPVTQMNWCNRYAISRYGSWQTAYEHFQIANSLF